MTTLFRRVGWLLCTLELACGASASQPAAVDGGASDGTARIEDGEAETGHDASPPGVDSAAQDSATDAGCPSSCPCNAPAQVTAAQACQLLQANAQAYGSIGSDVPALVAACESVCGSGNTCYVSPAYVQAAVAANGGSTGPFDAASLMCPSFPSSVTVACAPASC